MGFRNLQFLALALLAMTLVCTVSAGSDVQNKKPEYKPPSCKPAAYFGDACGEYVKKSYYKSPVPDYYSSCCEIVREESVSCLCKAASYKYYDLYKVELLGKKCGKYELIKCEAPKPYYYKSPPPKPYYYKSPPPKYYYKSPPPKPYYYKSPPPYYYYKSPPPKPYYYKSPPPYYYKSPPAYDSPPKHDYKSPPKYDSPPKHDYRSPPKYL